jgi:transposase
MIRPHVAQVRPARSPDLNPIEHLWDNMERQVAASQPAPINLNDLGNRLVEIWDAVDQDYIRHLTASRGRRCQAVVTTRGGNTCY